MSSPRTPLTLRLLGALDLRDADGTELRTVLVAPKRLALLAYLAVASPRGFHRRDALLALFWPDLTPERARQALRSTLHKLRPLLGDGVIAARGAEELAVDPALLRCDAVECERALEEGRLEEGCAAYGGDLLPGFWLSDAPELERWLDERRAALRRRVLDALRRLGERDAAAGRHSAAVAWARRATEIAPDDEEVVRRLMEALERAGDRLGAFAVYRDFARRLAAEYDATPSPATMAAAERMRAGATPPAPAPAAPRTQAAALSPYHPATGAIDLAHRITPPPSMHALPAAETPHPGDSARIESAHGASPPASRDSRAEPADTYRGDAAGIGSAPVAATHVGATSPAISVGATSPAVSADAAAASIGVALPASSGAGGAAAGAAPAPDPFPTTLAPPSLPASIVIPATTEEYRALRAGRRSRALQYLAVGARARGGAPGRGRAATALYLLAAIGLVAIVAALAGSMRRAEPATGALDESLVAVAPFRVDGADPSLAYLREGMIDLLGAKLTGEGGPRAADARTVVTAWQRSEAEGGEPDEARARGTAARIGAGLLVLGSVVGPPGRLTVTATLLRVGDGSARARASVEGPADSLTTLVDRLAARLLATGNERGQPLSDLTSTSLPALRAYLAGQAAYRAGRYDQAVGDFDRALERDSTFALAALGLAAAANWIQSADPAPFQRGRALVWRHRDRLAPRDRAVADVLVGARWPEPDDTRQRLEAAERLVRLAPDRAASWYELGDVLFHYGAILGIVDATDRASAVFRRAVALDSAFAPTLEHLLALAVRTGDTAAARSLARLYGERDSAATLAGYLRWRAALALGDNDALERARADFPRLPVPALLRVVNLGQLDGLPMRDILAAAALLPTRAATPEERWTTEVALRELALNRGRPAEAARHTARVVEGAPSHAPGRALLLMDALYASPPPLPDSARARLAADAAGRLRGPSGGAIARLHERCLTELGKLYGGDVSSAAAAAAGLRATIVAGDSFGAASLGRSCAALILARRAVVERAPDAAARVAVADSLVRRGPGIFPTFFNLEVARLREALGDRPGALAALRRRPDHFAYTAYLSAYLAEEGRLAAALGDRAGALRAWTHWLALHDAPELATAAEVERIRAALAALR